MFELTPALKVGIAFAYVGGFAFVATGIYLSVRRRRFHPLLLVCISAISFSWIEAPYDWVMYAQFHPALPRMPEWWPLDRTWGGLPSAVPPGYIAYFVLPAAIAAALGNWAAKRFNWRRPLALLNIGLAVGSIWAFGFNALFGPRFGIFYYGRVVGGLALWEGTKYQYPVYDALAMGVQMMVFSYLLGRTDSRGRTVIDIWADSRTRSKGRSALLSVVGFIVIGHVVYLSVFVPHLIVKEADLVDTGPTEQLFEGVANQPR